uniref:Uncharacterized protein n=1 Tax=Anguilla anguilla TaxID=7936 RepID=A0A0E9VLL8_ANGAN
MNVIWITATLLSRGLLAVAETEKCPDMPIHRITPGGQRVREVSEHDGGQR